MIGDTILRITDAVYENAFPFPHKSLHVSLILSGKSILAVGTNMDKTHPKIREHGYPGYSAMHSELHAYSKLNGYLRKDDALILVNARYSKTGILGMSKPCKYCYNWCAFIFQEIYYTDQSGVLVKL